MSQCKLEPVTLLQALDPIGFGFSPSGGLCFYVCDLFNSQAEWQQLLGSYFHGRGKHTRQQAQSLKSISCNMQADIPLAGASHMMEYKINRQEKVLFSDSNPVWCE